MSDTPLLRLEQYEGPLDLLLEQAQAHKIDLAQLSIVEIIDQFACAIEAALTSRPLAELGDWVVMAARLVPLRSRLMLAADAPDRIEAERDADALRLAVLRREQLARRAEWLEQRPRLGRDVFGRGGQGERKGRGQCRSNAADLLEACLTVLGQSERRRVPRHREPRLSYWTMQDALARIAALLPVLPCGSPLERYLPDLEPSDETGLTSADIVRRTRQQRAAVAGTLVAGLEMAKQGIVAMQQDAPHGSIRLRAGGIEKHHSSVSSGA